MPPALPVLRFAGACHSLLPPPARKARLQTRTKRTLPCGALNSPPCPYAYDALEPVIDAETMELHHSLHHQAYVNGLNNALEAREDLQGVPLEDLLARVGDLPVAFRNHGGGHWNHAFFWESMTAPGTGGCAQRRVCRGDQCHVRLA